MIHIPKDFNHNPIVDNKFRDLIQFFNDLEEGLRYPNCEGLADQKRVLATAQDALIMRGYL